MTDRDTTYSPGQTIEPEEQAYGTLSEPATKNFAAEDREAAGSEATGRIPKREVDELSADAGNIENVKGTRYKGKGNDAYKQERQLDQALSDEGTI